ncbi:hypothetical protein PZ02_10265, partial [Lacticaseibacillus rhamnosus]
TAIEQDPTLTSAEKRRKSKALPMKLLKPRPQLMRRGMLMKSPKRKKMGLKPSMGNISWAWI